MDQLVKQVHEEWIVAKQNAQQLCKRAGRYEMAMKIANCDMFSGSETMHELIDLMFSPQGIEFMTSFSFPNIKTLRKFKKYHPDKYGVFIDARNIALTDAKRIWVIGNTCAQLTYGRTQGNTVVAMHGASVNITAYNYAVVKTESDKKSQIEFNQYGQAIVSE